jgi:hypothetical protein
MALVPGPPVPVFPLPGLVLFPRVRVPLHVFEPRYRALVRDALAADRRIAIATLLPGWEDDYQGSPPFHPLACLAVLEAVEWLPDDRYDLQVRGASRVRLLEAVREFPYRACRHEVLPTTPYDEDDPHVAMERAALLAARERLLPLGSEAWVMPPQVPEGADFESLVHILAMALRMPTEARLELLAQDRVFDRARALHARLVRGPASA